MATCMRIQPEISVDSLVNVLTGPEYHEGYRGSRVYFDTPFLASNSIAARYDTLTGRVLELNCGGENGPLWKIDG